jgi:hypothetical protein
MEDWAKGFVVNAMPVTTGLAAHWLTPEPGAELPCLPTHLPRPINTSLLAKGARNPSGTAISRNTARPPANAQLIQGAKSPLGQPSLPSLAWGQRWVRAIHRKFPKDIKACGGYPSRRPAHPGTPACPLEGASSPVGNPEILTILITGAGSPAHAFCRYPATPLATPLEKPPHGAPCAFKQAFAIEGCPQAAPRGRDAPWPQECADEL